MRKRFVVTAMVAAAVAALGTAGPVFADDVTDSSASADAWLMPDVKGMTAAEATDALAEVTGGEAVDLHYQDRVQNQVVYNLTNWIVCDEGPSAGKAISQESKYVVFVVRRPNSKQCYPG
jgi:beta-lactam-binding protein with PASTA domain